MKNEIDRLIINSPYEEPKKYWEYDRANRSFILREGRRPAGYVIATQNSRAFDDPGLFVPIELVNRIRPRVKKWRESDYPGVTGITRRLLSHWREPEERLERRFFFCQLEAMETLIWLLEAPEAERTGIDIPGDGGDFVRWCLKMATGTGKTVVMAMVVAWQILNKVTDPANPLFSRHVLIIAPGLTVKSRLKVLSPFDEENYYDVFNIVPHSLFDRLRQGKVIIHNWHKLNWESEEAIAKKKTVDKRGPKSDEAYVREILEEMSNARNILVINDEAHHAWRVPAESKIRGVKKEEIEESTVWVGGLDRIHRSRGILRCFDFSATPFAPTGKTSSEEALYSWIVSDFGLNDAIEAGLVKTPRVVVRDDGKVAKKDIKSRLYHIYMDSEVKDDINRKADETEPLPDIIANAYYLLGIDWLETKKRWEDAGHKAPPVMITVANRTETSARIKYAFDHNQIMIKELCDPERTLQIDSRVLDMAESKEEAETVDTNTEKLTKSKQAELLRRQVDTVGQPGEPGGKIQNVISVGMLSEGWDAKTVTHIMGLRAFSSQLLCEQVVGRGLRRTSYDTTENGLFEAEYVNIFGVPFTFLPHEGGNGAPPPPPPKTKIEPVSEKKEYEITWPNIVRIDHIYMPVLNVDFETMEPLAIDPYENITEARLAAMIDGKPNLGVVSEIDLKDIADKYRLQTIIFETAKRIFNDEKPNWKGSPEIFFVQLIRIVEDFLVSDKIVIKDGLFTVSELRKRILFMLNMNKIIQHVWQSIRAENTMKLTPVFDREHPVRSTNDVRAWYTSKSNEWSKKSHINFTVYDSGWEAGEAYKLDKSKHVEAWVKNEHLNFAILYNYKGVIRKYYPDFIIRLKNNSHLILETKGQDSEQNQVKRKFLDEWVKAINQHGGFGSWTWDVSYHPNDLEGILERHVDE
jgi:type III restriction enzyme